MWFQTEPSLAAATTARGTGTRGAAVKPLDGGALSLTGNALAGEGIPCGAATYPPPGCQGRASSLDLSFVGLEKKGRGKRKEGREKGGADRGRVPCGAAPHRCWPLPATGKTKPAAAGQRCMREAWGRKNGGLGLRGKNVLAFCSLKGADGRMMEICGDGRSRSAKC